MPTTLFSEMQPRNARRKKRVRTRGPFSAKRLAAIAVLCGTQALASVAFADNFCKGRGAYVDASRCIQTGYDRSGRFTWTNRCNATLYLNWCYRGGGNYSCRGNGNRPTQFTGIAPGGTHVNWDGRATTYWAFFCR